jgi:hypothetical protein
MNEYHIKFLQCVSELKHNKRITVSSFIRHIRKNPIIINGEKLIIMNASNLFIIYNNYCIENGEQNACSMRKFGLDIKGKLGKIRKTSGIFYILPAS